MRLRVPEATASLAAAGLIPVLFLLMMRLVPLSGTHGAEHQVVHAIEREAELKPEVVRRMPRVHPRCGTNLAVGAIIFMSALDPGQDRKYLPGELQIRLLLGALAAFILWRPIGSLLQQYVTTKRPSDKQLEQGIRAGKDLIDNFATAKTAFPSPWLRIWHSGMLHVMAGAALTACLVWAAQALFHLTWLPPVF